MIPKSLLILSLFPQEMKTFEKGQNSGFSHEITWGVTRLNFLLAIFPRNSIIGIRSWISQRLQSCCNSIQNSPWLSSESFPVTCRSDILKIKYLGSGVFGVERICQVWTLVKFYPYFRRTAVPKLPFLVRDRADRCGFDFSTSHKCIEQLD